MHSIMYDNRPNKWSSIGWMIIAIFTISEGAFDITYEGKLYISEGSPFNITCIRSAYGSPKWYKNGHIIDPLSTEYQVTVENRAPSHILMGLNVLDALWDHRGVYRCDSLSGLSHKIEIVPTVETDRILGTTVKGRQKKVVLKPGKTLEVVCDTEEHEAFPINWYKDGLRVKEIEDMIEMEGRVLKIHQANLSDAGEYVCVFEERGQSYLYADHQGSKTWVTYGALVEDFPQQIRPMLDRNFSLECKVQGFPTPRISWFVDGIDLNHFMLNESRYSILENEEGLPNSVFFITDVTYEDNHMIMCVADNVDGFDQTITELAVRENAIFTNEEYPGSGLILVPGIDLVLFCNFTDQPSAVFDWFKDGSPLDRGPTSRFHFEPPTNNVLRIKDAEDSDCGNYSCVSSDVYAIIPVRSVVKIAPLDNSRNVVQGQNIILVCNATQGRPLPVLKWYKDEQELNYSDPRISLTRDNHTNIEGTTLTILNANFDDRAEYTCNATNEISSANITILVRVKDKYAALWPFLGICAEVAVLCTIIFIYEKRRQKQDFDESETEHNTENKNIPDQEDKGQDVRQRK